MSASARPDVLARWRAMLARGEPDLFDGALLIAQLVDPAEDAGRGAPDGRGAGRPDAEASAEARACSRR